MDCARRSNPGLCCGGSAAIPHVPLQPGRTRLRIPHHPAEQCITGTSMSDSSANKGIMPPNSWFFVRISISAGAATHHSATAQRRSPTPPDGSAAPPDRHEHPRPVHVQLRIVHPEIGADHQQPASDPVHIAPDTVQVGTSSGVSAAASAPITRTSSTFLWITPAPQGQLWRGGPLAVDYTG